MTSVFSPKIKEKRWDHAKELELIEDWEKCRIGSFSKSDIGRKKIIVIDTPPPYASGRWHVGGLAHYIHHDLIIRFFRMRGYSVLAPFYADRNGLPVEVYVEKVYNFSAHEVAATPEGREEFLRLCKKQLDKAESEIVKLWKRVGCSFEYWPEGTDSETYRTLTQSTFIELWRRGLIYLAERPVNWCSRCRTTLSDAELEYREEDGILYYIRFEIKEAGESVTIATTRPELLAACKAVIFNPIDSRYNKRLHGKHAVVPLYGHEVPVIPHEQADPNFGTGLVMICSYGDQTDIRLFRELGLEPRVLINEKGEMNENAGILEGLRVDAARARVVQILRERGYLVKTESIRQSVPACWRCGTRIEYIHRKEYFLKQLEFKQELLKVLDEIAFYPEHHKRKLVDWINSIATDWPISRDRYYATEIPVWKCTKCGRMLVPKEGRYYRPWKEPAPWDRCPECGAPREHLEGEKKVFDTWFDSSISPLYVSGYLRDHELYESVKNSIMRVQGYDIIRTWLYYSILRVYQLTGKPAFRWVRITGMGLDEKGEAMHKSKGNIIDPEPVLEEYGADAIRFWAAMASKVGYDYKFSPQLLRAGKLFATKLWNIARFVSMFPVSNLSVTELMELDQAILEKLNATAEAYIKGFESLEHFDPTLSIYKFAWDVFASNYIDTVKDRAYNASGSWSRREQEAAWTTLHLVLRSVLKFLAPIMPFVTDAIWRRLYGEEGRSIHEEPFEAPRPEWNTGKSHLMDLLMEINSEIWRFKKSRGMRLKDPLNARLYIPREAEPLAKHLKVLHNVREVVVGEPSGGTVERIGVVSLELY